MENTQVFEQVFGLSHDHSDSKGLLEKITGQYPYFAPARFFLLQQLNAGSHEFVKEAAVANLFFNNPHWMAFKLRKKEAVAVAVAAAVEPVTEDEVAVAAAVEPVTEDEVAAAAAVEQKAAAVAVEQVEMPENNDNDDDLVVTETLVEPAAEIAAVPAAVAVEPVAEVEVAAAVAVEPVSEVEAAAAVEQVEMPENNDNNDDQVMAASIAAVVEQQGPAETQHLKETPASLSSEAMLFEPMHMVDYFASQGIKLSEEAQTGDKLGKQLKSFTEWLKTMKKLHPASTAQPAEVTDKNIQQLAEKSNTEDEVLTESMAEVFAKQGKKDRALEVYQKLSLLNPSKSAYFAAKIDYLNSI